MKNESSFITIFCHFGLEMVIRRLTAIHSDVIIQARENRWKQLWNKSVSTNHRLQWQMLDYFMCNPQGDYLFKSDWNTVPSLGLLLLLLLLLLEHGICEPHEKFLINFFLVCVSFFREFEMRTYELKQHHALNADVFFNSHFGKSYRLQGTWALASHILCSAIKVIKRSMNQ